MSNKKKTPAPSTLAALMQDKPKRGRPRDAVSRQSVYIELSQAQKIQMKEMATLMPKEIKRSDIPDLAVSTLSARMDSLRQAVSGRNREIPEGITDFESLYLLWDLPLPEQNVALKWTSVRLSPQPSIELGRIHGMFNAVFNTSRSETFSLGLTLLENFIETILPTLQEEIKSLDEWRRTISGNYS